MARTWQFELINANLLLEKEEEDLNVIYGFKEGRGEKEIPYDHGLQLIAVLLNFIVASSLFIQLGYGAF